MIETLCNSIITNMCKKEDPTIEQAEIDDLLSTFDFSRCQDEPEATYIDRISSLLVDPKTEATVKEFMQKNYYAFEGRVSACVKIVVHAKDEYTARSHLEQFTNYENYVDFLELEEVQCVGTLRTFDEECEEALC